MKRDDSPRAPCAVRVSVTGFVLVCTGLLVAVLLIPPGISQAERSHAVPSTKYYVSLGDSYSVGYEPPSSPCGVPVDCGATSGYSGYVSKKEHLKLVNFGCGGATTSSILDYNGKCVVDPSLAQYGPPAEAGLGPVAEAGDTQLENAMTFIEAHVGHIGLITVSIGASDVTACATASDQMSCFAAAAGLIQANVTELADELRFAAGSEVPLIGLTYPDAFLGSWVYPAGDPDQSLATESQTAFALINDALSAAYVGAGGAVVDVTGAAWGSAMSGAYTSLGDTTTLKGYGTVPVAVAEICELTYYCSSGKIYANTKGYDFIGSLIVKEYSELAH